VARGFSGDEIRPYRNFAPFVRQTSERKAQTCANEMLQQAITKTPTDYAELQPFAQLTNHQKGELVSMRALHEKEFSSTGQRLE
jgi:hypothetical protein